MFKHQDEMAHEIKEKMRGGEGSVEIMHVFTQNELTGKCRMFAKVTLNPGCSIGTHVHDQEEEIYYILSGSGRADDNGEIKEIHTGDALLTGGGHHHSIENTGSEPLVFMAVVLLY